jgi:BBSome-interacting protein 1
MAEIHEILPKQGKLYQEDIPAMVLCKPKLLPLKSVTLEKLEKMQKEAEKTVRQQAKDEEAAAAQAGESFFQ